MNLCCPNCSNQVAFRQHALYILETLNCHQKFYDPGRKFWDIFKGCYFPGSVISTNEPEGRATLSFSFKTPLPPSLSATYVASRAVFTWCLFHWNVVLNSSNLLLFSLRKEAMPRAREDAFAVSRELSPVCACLGSVLTAYSRLLVHLLYSRSLRCRWVGAAPWGVSVNKVKRPCFCSWGVCNLIWRKRKMYK